MNKKPLDIYHLNFKQVWLAALLLSILTLLVLTIANKANMIGSDRANAVAAWNQSQDEAPRAATETAMLYTLRDGARQPGKTASVPIMKKICFSRGPYIYLFETETRSVKRVAKGDEPAISPQGDTIAFTANEGNERADSRTIKTINIESKREIAYPSLSTVHSFGPRWSHDGTRLAFSFYITGQRLRVGILTPSTGTWSDITQSLQLTDIDDLHFDSWLEDDKSILCHNLDTIYEISLEGKLLQSFPIDKITDPGEISSATRFSFSSDRKYLLFDSMSTPEDTYLSLYDFEKESQLRLTPKTISPLQPEWLPSNKEILFVHYKGEGKHLAFDVCKISLDGAGVTTLIKDASHASYSIR